MHGGKFKYDPDSGSPISPTPWLLGIGGLAHAAVERVVQVDWSGDNSNNRLIDMGVVCNLVIVLTQDQQQPTTDHLGLAYATQPFFGIFLNDGATEVTSHASNQAVACFQNWQGIVFGTQNIKCGSVGTGAKGTNASGKSYRAIGFKFRDFP